MSERERWIVYPLLFLALGAALRDKLLKQTRAEQIVCERLILVDNENQPTAALVGDAATPISREEVNMARSGGARIVAGFVYSGLVESETFTQRGKPLVGRPTPPSGQPGASFRVPFQEFLRMFPQFRSVLPKESDLSKDVPVGPPAGEAEAPPTDLQPEASPPAQGPALQPPAVEPAEGA